MLWLVLDQPQDRSDSMTPKTRPLRRLAAVAVAGAAALALPAVASADTAGSDFSRADAAGPIRCTDDNDAQVPCTLAQDNIGWSVEVPSDSIVTSWKAQLDSGTQARLRVLRRNGDGSFTSVGQSAPVTGSGGVQTFTTHIPVPSGSSFTVAIDVTSGSVGAVADGNSAMVAFDPQMSSGQTASGATYGYELMLSAEAEHDYDGDGLGDVTEDPCLWSCDSSGGGSDGSADSGTGYSGGGSGSGSSEPKGAQFEIDKRSLLREGAAGSSGYIAVYTDNTGDTNLKGKLTLTVGGKAIGTASVDQDWGDDYQYGLFKLKGAARRKVMRGGKVKAVAIAKLRGDNGKSITVKKNLTVLRGGNAAYDGTYRGPGPVVIKVERGVVVAISASMNTYCIGSHKFQQRAFMRVPGFPALVGRNGSFSAKGGISTDTVKYYGKLSKRGTSKGYMSLFHTELGLTSEGKLNPDTCYDAKHFKVKRSS
jgi:hypothetical protein